MWPAFALLWLAAATSRGDARQPCVANGAKLEQADEELADARDADLLCRTLHRKRLSAEESADMEAAALRRLERRKAIVAKLQRLADIGAVPVSKVNAAIEEVDAAVKDYVLAVSRTALGGDAEYEPLERFDGNGSFTPEDFNRVQSAFEREFHRSLPVSAHGETSVHRSLGYNHRGRVDIALFPDAIEGLWLRRYLESNSIPYRAFRGYIPGTATAAHIHIGPPSGRIQPTD